jgi:hypothetical protein
MKNFIFSLLLCPLFLVSSLFGHYEEVKQEIKVLKNDCYWKSILFGYDAYFAAGSYDAYRKALIVINKWERKYKPKRPPRFRIKDDLLVLVSISDEESDQGFDAVEDSWKCGGFRNGILRSISIIDGKPYVSDGVYH